MRYPGVPKCRDFRCLEMRITVGDCGQAECPWRHIALEREVTDSLAESTDAGQESSHSLSPATRALKEGALLSPTHPFVHDGYNDEMCMQRVLWGGQTGTHDLGWHQPQQGRQSVLPSECTLKVYMSAARRQLRSWPSTNSLPGRAAVYIAEYQSKKITLMTGSLSHTSTCQGFCNPKRPQVKSQPW